MKTRTKDESCITDTLPESRPCPEELEITTKDESCIAETPPESRPHPIEHSSRHTGEKADVSVKNSSTTRITSSSFAIAWSTIILVFVTFFNHYIAYYQPESIDGVSRWIRYPILTGAFTSWLPILVATLILFIIGHITVIYFGKYLIQETTLTVLNLFAIATALSLLFIFPFDFTGIPDVEIATVFHMFTKVAIIGIVVALGAGTLVRLIRLIANLSLHKA